METPVTSIRVDKPVRDAWEDTAQKLGYKNLSEFIIETMNEKCLTNIQCITELNYQVITEKDRDMKRKKIAYLQKGNRSAAFEVPRFIKILRCYKSEENFIDEPYLIRELELFMAKSKINGNEKQALLNILPELKNHGWYNGLNQVRTKLIELGTSKQKIETAFKINSNSIGQQKRIVTREPSESAVSSQD